MTAPPRPAMRREVRIIGGQWKRTKLPVSDAPGLRPTPDRVRETVFNWLGQNLTGWRCLDAFAGSGALGFEAASRGATDVVLIERDRKLAAGLAAVKQRLDANERTNPRRLQFRDLAFQIPHRLGFELGRHGILDVEHGGARGDADRLADPVAAMRGHE